MTVRVDQMATLPYVRKPNLFVHCTTRLTFVTVAIHPRSIAVTFAGVFPVA